MGVTGLAGERLAELQLTLGEGPCRDVMASAAPVLAADLGDAESARRWPGFTPAPPARRRGGLRLPVDRRGDPRGVLGLYRGSPGPLPDRQLGDLLILADVATVLLLGRAHRYPEDENTVGLDGQARDLALHRAEIDQATGMLTVQLGVSAGEAFARLRAYAYSQDRRLADVAGDIVARRLRLHRDQDPGGGP
jgi:ANTAR domain